MRQMIFGAVAALLVVASSRWGDLQTQDDGVQPTPCIERATFAVPPPPLCQPTPMKPASDIVLAKA